MRGLLLKDLYTLKKVLSWVYLFPLIVILVCGSANYAFLASAIILVLPLFSGFALYNIMYAEENSNWGRYVKALPVGAQVIAAEKYVMGAILLGVAFLLDGASVVLFSQLGVEASFLASMLLLAIALGVVYVAILIPSILKYGASRGPMVFIGCVGCLMVVPTALSKLNLMEYALAVAADPLFQLLGGLLVPATFTFLSYLLSRNLIRSCLMD